MRCFPSLKAQMLWFSPVRPWGRRSTPSQQTRGAPILRTDGALAAAAARAGGRIVALCAVEATIDPTSRLFFDAVQQSEATVEVQLVPEAWAMFKASDLDGYLATIAKAADGAYAGGASIVALTQASMSGAAALVSAGPHPLSSPTAGLAAALEAASRRLGLGTTSQTHIAG